MLISCLLISHNKPVFVDEAIQSVLSQSHLDWELLIMDSGVLCDTNYFNKYKDSRITLIRSHETEEIRKSVAIAPWCYNYLINSGIIKGDLILHLCDDDIYYPNGFAIFHECLRRNPDWLACYSSQDHGNYCPPNIPIITGVRHAHIIRGRGIRRLDCEVDYLQLCFRKQLWNVIPKEGFWNEDRKHKNHSDGLLLEKIGTKVRINPIPFKTGFNRRTPVSDNIPFRK